MVRAFNIAEDLKYNLIHSEFIQLPPNSNLLILEIPHDSGFIRLRFIFSMKGKEFSLSVKKSDNDKFLDYYFYNWNSEYFVDLKKPLNIKFKERVYIFNFSTKINPFTNIRTIQFTLWEIL